MMLSRVAEQTYWLARYMERAEDTARLFQVVSALHLDLGQRLPLDWRSLLIINGQEQEFMARFPQVTEASVMHFMLADSQNSGSLWRSLQAARENLRSMREVFPPETWEYVNDLYQYAKLALPQVIYPHKRFEILQEIIEKRQRLLGLIVSTFPDNAISQFLALGRNIERADMTTRIVDVAYIGLKSDSEAPYQDLRWMAVLKTLSAYYFYRTKVQVSVNASAVLEFLLKDEEFPRTIGHCIRRLHHELSALPRAEAPLLAVDNLLNFIEKIDGEEIIATGLHEAIDEIQAGLMAVDAAIQQRFF
jgi:uncharacterized alpha-E superfamily protein